MTHRVLVVTGRETRLRLDGDRLVVERRDRVVQRVGFDELGDIVCIGRVELTGAAAWRCLREGVRVSFVDARGRPLGALRGPDPRRAALRLRQYAATTDDERRLALARPMVYAKVHNQRRVLQKRQGRLRDPDIARALAHLSMLLRRIEAAEGIEELRGLEGDAARAYFGVFGRLLTNPAFTFGGRTRRPPRDPVNAMLSLGYTVVGTLLEGMVEASGLDTALGFFHEPRAGRPSLMLDLLEEFRPVAVDTLVLAIVNRGQLAPVDFGPPEDDGLDWEDVDDDERREVLAVLPELAARSDEPAGRRPDRRGAVYMRGAARKVFLSALLERLRARMVYPARGIGMELREIMRAQVYELARALSDTALPYRGFHWR